MHLLFFALNKEQSKNILSNCLPEGFSWSAFEPGEKMSVLLLFSPVWCNEHFVSPDINWKIYLAKHHPEVKLISLGFRSMRHSNYIDLLKPPKDLYLFLEQAKSCSGNWWPVDTGGLEMNRKLIRFFDGHGRESLQESFNILLRRFRIVRDELARGVSYEEVYRALLEPGDTVARWQKLRNRWQAYYPFFACLPFYNFFISVDHLIQDLQPFFDLECKNYKMLIEVQLIEKIEAINQLLTEAENYVEKEPPHTDC